MSTPLEYGMPLPKLTAVKGNPGIAIDQQGRYWVRIRLGKDVHRELRNSLTDAIQRRDALKVQHRARTALPGSRHWVAPKKILLAELIEMVRQSQDGLVTESTLKRYRVSELAILRLMGEKIQLREVTARVVEDFRTVRRREVEPATVNRDLTRLHTLLHEACRLKLIAEVPFEFSRSRYREPEGRIHYLSDLEEEDLMEAADPYLRPFIQFALLTGFRLNEQLQLSWDSVHRTKIILSGSRTKTHRRRVVPITPKLQAILDEQKGKSEKWVFPNKGDTNFWNVQNFYRELWNPARDRAGLLNFNWHDFRHTFCSRLIQRGANLVAVKELAGHRSVEVTMRYVHLAPSHLLDTMNLL